MARQRRAQLGALLETLGVPPLIFARPAEELLDAGLDAIGSTFFALGDAALGCARSEGGAA